MSDSQNHGLDDLTQRLHALSEQVNEPRLRPFQGAPLPIGPPGGRGPAYGAFEDVRITPPPPPPVNSPVASQPPSLGAQYASQPASYPTSPLQTPPYQPASKAPFEPFSDYAHAAPSANGSYSQVSVFSAPPPPAPSSPAQPGPAQPSQAQSGPAPSHLAQLNAAPSNATYTGPAQVSPTQTSPTQTSPAQASPAQAVSSFPATGFVSTPYPSASTSAGAVGAATPQATGPAASAANPAAGYGSEAAHALPAPPPDDPNAGKTGLQRAVQAVRSAIPIVQRLLPLLDGNFATVLSSLVTQQPHHPPPPPPARVDLEPINRGLAEVRDSQRELTTQLQDQGASLKRVEDHLERVREATDRNTLEQQELVEDLRSVGSRLSLFAIIGLILLVISLGLNVFFLIQLQHILR